MALPRTTYPLSSKPVSRATLATRPPSWPWCMPGDYRIPSNGCAAVFDSPEEAHHVSPAHPPKGHNMKVQGGERKYTGAVVSPRMMPAVCIESDSRVVFPICMNKNMASGRSFTRACHNNKYKMSVPIRSRRLSWVLGELSFMQAGESGACFRTSE
jgi:hypothetical protein